MGDEGGKVRFPPFIPHTPSIPLPQMAVVGPLHQNMTSAIPTWSLTSRFGATGSKKRCFGFGEADSRNGRPKRRACGCLPPTAAFPDGEWGVAGAIPWEKMERRSLRLGLYQRNWAAPEPLLD